MIKIISEETKTKEEGLKKILKKLNCKEEDLFLDADLIEGKLFKSSKYLVRAVKKDEIKDEIEITLKEIGKLFNIVLDSQIEIINNSYNISIITDNNSVLIGKNGRTLNAIQLLLRQKIRNEINLGIKINVDISNYKVNKMNNIEREMKNIAKDVIQSKIDVSLDPMNSYERRFVHNIINDYEELITESIGEGRDRHIVIKYNKKI